MHSLTYCSVFCFGDRTWRTLVCFMYSMGIVGIAVAATQIMLFVSSGMDLVLNALAIAFVVDLDEQLIVYMVPLTVRNAIIREFRDARDAAYPASVMGTRRSAWGWWKSTFWAMMGWWCGVGWLYLPSWLVDPVDK